MPGPKPGALPAWRPPSAFGFKGSAPAFSLIYVVKTDSRRNTTRALSRRIEQSKLYGPNRRATASHECRAEPARTFDFSSLRAGNAMLLMRFFAVNPQCAQACTDIADLWISGYFVVGFAVQGGGRNHGCERRALADLYCRAFGLLGGIEQAKNRAAAARHLRRARA